MHHSHPSSARVMEVHILVQGGVLVCEMGCCISKESLRNSRICKVGRRGSKDVPGRIWFGVVNGWLSAHLHPKAAMKEEPQNKTGPL